MELKRDKEVEDKGGGEAYELVLEVQQGDQRLFSRFLPPKHNTPKPQRIHNNMALPTLRSLLLDSSHFDTIEAQELRT